MNLPSDFTEYTIKLMGESLYGRLAAGLDSGSQPVSIRLNPFKAGGRDVSSGTLAGVVSWCPGTGRYLNSRPDFTFDPLFHAGAYYVQEAASMFVDYVVRSLVHMPVRMLDLCAAPGGKSTTLRAALPEGSVLFSNEPVRARANVLAENMQKFGHEDVVVTNNYPRDYRKSRLLFDAILADVPCSGEGMFRKDDGARAEWSLQNVDNCWRLQRDIVADVWDCLRPGGLLVYSTCTFNAHENEENVEWIARELGADLVSLPLDPEWNITGALVGSSPVCRFMPGVSRSEGLFVAVLRKHGDSPMVGGTVSEQVRKGRRGQSPKAGLHARTENVCLHLDGAADFVERRCGDSIYAIPKRWTGVYDAACASLRVMHAGVCVGTVKGRDVVPGQSLALSRLLDAGSFASVELTYRDAVAFLRKEAVALPDGTPRGFVLLTYGGLPIGFEKNIGNRANNLYPSEWRVKSAHIPEEPQVIK